MKSRKWGIPAALAAAAFFFTGTVSAQDDEGGPTTWGEDAKYVTVTHVKFKPGQREAAMEIIAEKFVAAGMASGDPGPKLVIHYQTGKWDAAWVWELENGTADLEWYQSPGDVKWWAELVKIEGGEEEAGALMAKFMDMVADVHSELGHYHTGEEAE